MSRRLVVLAGALVLMLFGCVTGAVIDSFDAGAATSETVYACVATNNVVRPNVYTHVGSPIACPAASDRVISWAVTGNPQSTTSSTSTSSTSSTTRPSTTTSSTSTSSTTTTTVPGGCSGVSVNQPSDISQPNTVYCISGTHNWTLHPKSGDTISGGILDGGKSTGFAIVADPCVTNVTLRNIEVRNYTVNGGDFRGAITVGDNCATGWKLNNLWVHNIGVVGSGGAGAELSNGWVVTGGRYNDNAQEGLTNGDGGQAFTVDGAELDHNNFRDATYTAQSVSCGHEAGGMKFVADGVTVKNSYVHHNACIGLWADIDSVNTTITNNRVVDNWNIGIDMEISQGGVISGNTVTGNGFNTGQGPCGDYGWGAGIAIIDSSGYTISGNHLSGNCNGIALLDGDSDPATHRTQDVSVTNNTVDASGFTGYFNHFGRGPLNIAFSGNTFTGGSVFCGTTC